MTRGWFLTRSPFSEPAHYYGAGTLPACGDPSYRGARWTLAEHLGAVTLCEGCKARLRAPGGVS